MANIQNIELTKLKLDPQNPRLPKSLQRDERSILNYIAKSTAIEDLMDSIAKNDFFPGEPVVVVPETEQNDKWIVVEGNRKLTAVILLHNPNKCEDPSNRMLAISNEAKYKPNEIPVVMFETRENVFPYLGFRHITGVKEWEPLAKARYIEQLFKFMGGINVTNSCDLSTIYSKVASAIGSRKDHVKRNLDALAVYKLMKQNDFYNIRGLDEQSIKFSILSTALADNNIGAFVGVVKQNKDGTFESTNPIIFSGAISEEAVKELAEWLYKPDNKGLTRVGESKNLRKLSAVLNSPNALETFRKGAPLEIAYKKTSNK